MDFIKQWKEFRENHKKKEPVIRVKKEYKNKDANLTYITDDKGNVVKVLRKKYENHE